MRALAITVLVTSILGAAGVAVVSAQEPSPEAVGIGGRVEVAEAGFAVTLPDGWLWATTSSSDSAELSTLVDAADPERGPSLSAVLTELAAYDSVPDLYVLAPVGPDRPIVAESCAATVRLVSGDSLEERMAVNEAGVSNKPEASVTGTHIVDLPAGEAGRLDYVEPMEFTDMGVVTIHGSMYFLTGETWEYGLTCLAAAAPDDRWLSIAETFEFLPAEE
jgi:hypothetical protein